MNAGENIDKDLKDLKGIRVVKIFEAGDELPQEI